METSPCNIEIGSEFWDIPTSNNKNCLFPITVECFLAGRSALKAIIADIQQENQDVKTVSLPSWCCDCIIRPFIDAGISVEFYPVLGLEQHLKGITTDIVLLMDFFGYTGYSKIENYNGIIIRDVTHSLFSMKYDDADYYFGSLRKWAGFWTGGYAWGFKKPLPQLPQNEEYVRLRQKAMETKMAFLDGQTDSKSYLKTFSDAENMLDHCGIELAAQRDVQKAYALDVCFIRQCRRRNAGLLLDALGDLAVFKDFKDCDCPMFVPIMVPHGLRDNLRKYLIDQQIYCPVHWPISRYHRLTSKERFIYDNELSLVCDQRYNSDDMYRIIDTINQFLTQTSC